MTNNRLIPTSKTSKIICYVMSCLFLLLVSEAALCAAAKNLGDMANNVTGSMGAVKSLLVGISYITGIGFTLGAMFQFKMHKETPTQTPVTKPIVLLFVGISLIFLPDFIQMSADTFGLKNKGSASGGGLETLGY